jgi:hypothetical protein
MRLLKIHYDHQRNVNLYLNYHVDIHNFYLNYALQNQPNRPCYKKYFYPYWGLLRE